MPLKFSLPGTIALMKAADVDGITDLIAALVPGNRLYTRNNFWQTTAQADLVPYFIRPAWLDDGDMANYTLIRSPNVPRDLALGDHIQNEGAKVPDLGLAIRLFHPMARLMTEGTDYIALASRDVPVRKMQITAHLPATGTYQEDILTLVRGVLPRKASTSS
jgi:hypothetical protein